MMKNYKLYLITFLFFTIAINSFSQEEKDKIQKDGQCSFYYSEILDKNIYTLSHVIPEFEPRETDFIMDILLNLNLTKEEYQKTVKICGTYLFFSIIIDEKGKVISYTPSFHRNKECKRRKNISPADEKIETIVLETLGWKPAMCNGENVAGIRTFRLSTYMMMPKELINE